MTTEERDELTIQAIHKVVQKLRGNREACRQFLIDADIILPDKKTRKAKRKK